MMEQAPFFADVARAHAGAQAWWVKTADGVRLRVALLAPPPDRCKGTILLFTGRTEYIEKYGDAAVEMHTRGFASLSLDWRGQGLSDRALDESGTGHVDAFSEYQTDVASVLGVAEKLDLPRPYFLLAHSMGGGIGLRSLHSGIPVNAAAFSAPMWGIAFSPWLSPIMHSLSSITRAIGLGKNNVYRKKPETYVIDAEFDDNTLTTDREMFRWMREQVVAYPDLALGGPSIAWLNEALIETRELERLPAPDVPTITWVGSNERIVDKCAVHQTMSGWKKGTLHEVPGAEHELMMERAEVRIAFFDAIGDLFSEHA